MTALLPPIVPSPFSKHFVQKPYNFKDELSRYPSILNASSTSLGNVLSNSSRQVSDMSAASIRSAPMFSADENHVRPIPIPGGGVNKSRKQQYGHRHCTAPVLKDVLQPPVARSLPTPANRNIQGRREACTDEKPVQEEDIVRRALADLHQSPRRSERGERQLVSRESHQCQTNHPSPGDGGIQRSPRLQIEQSLRGRGRFGSHRLRSPLKAPSTHHQQLSSSPPRTPIFSHQRNRFSDASSGFVHTVKTASLSNASISLFPRSIRLGRSTDTQGYVSSHVRFSLDSDRPPTNSSLDEASVRRAVKRQQIIHELMTSEESYLADLKALVYLYSTLLASSSSLTSRARSSVHRNVTDLLHLHEQFVKELHQASFLAATRKWADTASPRRLGASRRLRWRSLEAGVVPRSTRKHRRTRSSLESSEMTPVQVRLRSADPAEAADVAHVFKSLMPRFFAYEEYCANYESIVQEMHKSMPRWSAFETGIEALAKSVNSLNIKEEERRKALTVGDLLVKPIQRVCKYPLLLSDLLKNTPVVDCPGAHADIESALICLRDIVKDVNLATDNPCARRQIQKRWLLHERLLFNDNVLQASQFRTLGNAELCGVLHIAYQSRQRVDGCYSMCMLFGSYFVLAVPAGATGKFLIVAVIHLSDLKVDSASDGRGLQCHTALYTWKLSFEANGQLYELVMSACSAIEEEQWQLGLQKRISAPAERAGRPVLSSVSLDLNLRPSGIVFCQASTLTRRLSIQRAATVGNRASVCQVIVRNTHNPQDLQDFRQHSPASINRSQSHLTTHRTVVLAPKRSERSRLEATLSDVWTRDKLPYPGMVSSRGGQIIRASAGSLVRKLSLASMHGPFGRRSSSLTLAHQKSYDALVDLRQEHGKELPPVPAFEIKKDSHDGPAELDGVSEQRTLERTLDGALEVGLDNSKRTSFSGPDGLFRRATKRRERRFSRAAAELGPEDPAKEFYVATEGEGVEEKLGSKKRWSNPIGLLKNLSADGIRHMLYSTR